MVFSMVGCEPEEVVDDVDVAESVEILFVEWDCATASTYVAKAVLEDMGYEVEVTPVAAAMMWSGLAAGDGDFISCAWLPGTHGEYYEEYGDDVVEIATHYEGARIGLVTPTYMDITSITEVDDYVSDITGIDPGAGIMAATEDAIDTYGLAAGLIEGSDAAMTAELSTAIANDENIVVTGWTPHWKFAEWDLKFLEDPENAFGDEEYIANVGRAGLQEDLAEVYEFLENFSWGDDEIGAVMEMNAEDPDYEGNARKWIDENQDIVNTWIP
ncbi:MAG: glycine betaine ABC transporter substrate-binding protein [Candidatus Syntrophonatronum acetioxidans]|uniref:Glycine betaine ABC transporter substrate-binding protein n=1 Tax=Candidatus Syntrophonatronum acetioxidans TaxID=1795816 RepID=A0A424YAT9_9FIRM|nr:MAG: glycine betaine ABC transporter substrate-binding protein [Candidatus Syntrophonatronum acetioxidans]